MISRPRKTSSSARLAASLFDEDSSDAIPLAGPESWQADREENLLRARAALREAPRDADRLNNLGLALLALAEPVSDAMALGALEEAQRRFSRAAEEAGRQSAPAAACRRLVINRALALSMLGEERKDPATIEHALEILEPVIAALNAEGISGPILQVDWARALDIEGNALAALGRIDAAISAYDAALEKTRNPKAIARILRNLAITLAGSGRHADARQRLEGGFTAVLRSKEPLAWARLQRTLGDILSAWAESLKLKEDTQQAERYFSEAVSAYHAARDAYAQTGARQEVLSLSVPLATAEVQLGAQLCMSPDLAARQDGLVTIEDAISSLANSVRQMSPEGRDKARQAVEASRAIFDYISGIYNNSSNYENMYGVILKNISINFGIIESMANDNTKLIADIEKRLLDIPPAERREALRALNARFDMPLREAADELTGSSQEPPRLTLPEKAPKLYKDRPKGQTIIDFLRDPDGWGPYVAAGMLSRPDLRRLDSQAYTAVENWLRHDPLPPDVFLPKKSDIVDVEITLTPYGQADIRTVQRLARARQRRSSLSV